MTPIAPSTRREGTLDRSFCACVLTSRCAEKNAKAPAQAMGMISYNKLKLKENSMDKFLKLMTWT
jgi:hypothetical protein